MNNPKELDTLEAESLRSQNQGEVAYEKYAEAATIEEKLSLAYRNEGLLEKAGTHLFGAAMSWTQAGDFYRAVSLAESVLQKSIAPEEIRIKAHKLVAIIRARRVAFNQEMQPTKASSEG